MLLLALNELFFSFTSLAKRRRRKSHFGCNNKYLHIIDFFSLLLYRSSRENFGLRCCREVRISFTMQPWRNASMIRRWGFSNIGSVFVLSLWTGIFDYVELNRVRIKWNQPERHRSFFGCTLDNLFSRSLLLIARFYGRKRESRNLKIFMWCFCVSWGSSPSPNHMEVDRKLVNLFYDFFARAYICFSISICSEIMRVWVNLII